MNTPPAADVPDELSGPPPAAQLFAHTDWAALEHANPFPFDLAETLAELLAQSLTARSSALRALLQAVHHQNTIYSSTTPVAVYAAALLLDPRTENIEVNDRGKPSQPLQAALLDWLGELAYDVCDDSLAAAHRRGFTTTTEEAELRAARPMILHAAIACTRAPDPAVRHAAVIATLRLLDIKQPTQQQQAEYSPLIQEVLAESTHRYHRAVALDTLDAWGWDTTAYQPVQPAITVPPQ
jgi:hypothetical protein